MIYLGAYFPEKSMERSAFSDSLTYVAALLTRYQQTLKANNDQDIELKFLLKGQKEKPDFHGMLLRDYDRETHTIRVESVVPEHIRGKKVAIDFILAAMLDAVDNCLAFLLTLDGTADMSSTRKVVEQITTLINEDSIAIN